MLISAVGAPGYGATPGSVSGVVRDSSGVAQMGAEVQLLRADSSVLASVFTDERGYFLIASVLPGRYSVKAMGISFLPSLRENVHVRAKTVVNLTLNTLYDVMQWLPAEPRAGKGQKDDWAWTLRSAANRPLLRWLEDGPLVVVSDGSGAQPRLKARLVATGQEGSFGESGERISAAIEETPSNSRELLAQVDFAPGTDADMESMLGFRQDLGMAGSVQSVAAIAIHPEIDASSDAPGGSSGLSGGLNEAMLRTWETLNLGDEFEGEVGSNQILVHLSSQGPEGTHRTVTDILPFATAAWRDGASAVRYRMATQRPGPPNAGDTEARAWLPVVSARNGNLAIEHGLHQELGWDRHTDRSSASVIVFADKLDNPSLEAFSNFAANSHFAAAVLLDPVSNLIHATGPGYATTGVAASFSHTLPIGSYLQLAYANGDALVMPAAPAHTSRSQSLSQVLSAVHPRRAPMYSISLSGTLDGTGTRWRATYRWQPEDTVTQVAPFALDASDPYLNLHLNQPFQLRRDGASTLDLIFDVRNLLAEGYRPFVLSDGSLLVFAQDQRSFRAGLAFSF